MVDEDLLDGFKIAGVALNDLEVAFDKLRR